MRIHTDENTPTETDEEETEVAKNIDKGDEQKPGILDFESSEYSTKFPKAIAMEESAEAWIHNAEESEISATEVSSKSKVLNDEESEVPAAAAPG